MRIPKALGVRVRVGSEPSHFFPPGQCKARDCLCWSGLAGWKRLSHNIGRLLFQFWGCCQFQRAFWASSSPLTAHPFPR